MVEFNDAGSLVSTVSQFKLDETTPNFAQIVHIFNNLNNGCKCTHHQRVANMNNSYVSMMGKFSEKEVELFKQSLGTPIIFRHEGTEIGKIE